MTMVLLQPKIMFFIFIILQVFHTNSLYIYKLHKILYHSHLSKHKYHQLYSTSDNKQNDLFPKLKDRPNKLLEDARKLRLEAELLETQNIYNTTTTATTTSSQSSYRNNEFIAEAKLKPLNASSTVVNAEFNPMKNVLDVFVETNKSILVERKDLNKNKILANKITSGNIPSTTRTKISEILSSRPTSKDSEVGSIKIETLSTNYTSINLNMTKLPSNMLPDQYDKLKNLEGSVYKSLEPWWLRWGYRAIAQDALNNYLQQRQQDDENKESIEEDIILFKAAFVIELYQILEVSDEEEIDLLSFISVHYSSSNLVLDRMELLRHLYLSAHSVASEDIQELAMKAMEPNLSTSSSDSETDDNSNIEMIDSIKDDDNKLDSLDIFNTEIQSMTELMNNMLERKENSTTLLRSPNVSKLTNQENINSTNAVNTSYALDKTVPSSFTSSTTTNGNDSISDTISQEQESDDTETLLNSFFSQLEDAISEENSEVVRTSAEAFIQDYFDTNSRKTGLAINREGAGRFQNEVLKNVMTVSDVKLVDGAVIFNGRSSTVANKMMGINEMAMKINEKYNNSSFVNEIDYILMKNEMFVNLDNGMQQAALDSLLGSSPAIIIYPKSWNSTVVSVINDPGKKFFRTVISSCAITTSLIYAIDRVNLFDANSLFMKAGEVSEYLFPMALASVFIQNFASFIEFFVAKSKNFEITQVFLPAFSELLFNFGQRSTYLTKPKNRNDIFDTSLSKIITTLILSLTAMVVGQQLTQSDPNEIIINYPTIPISLLQVNTFISQVFLKQFGDLYQVFVPFSSEISASLVDNFAHLHWLTIIGITSFITTIFQLLPFDNSAGGKLTGAVLGRENYQALTVILTAFKTIFILLMIFNVGGYSSSILLNKQRLLLDYFIVSQLVHNEKEIQLAQDNITEVSDGRKSIYYALLGMIFISFLPYQQISTDLTRFINNLIDSAKHIF